MNGAELIAAERQRQMDVEGWTPAHDADHDLGELLGAAICYAWEAYAPGEGLLTGWPEEWEWKPSPDPIRNLVKAGALIAAEIDRRAAAEEGEGQK